MPIRRRSALVGLVLGLTLVAILLAASGYAGEAVFRARAAISGEPKAALTDVRSPEQLGAAFDAAAGRPRLVLFLSPT